MAFEVFEVCKLSIDKNRKENEIRGTTMFPLGAYYNDMDRYPACEVPWHWHEEIEVIYIAQGSVYAYIRSEEILLQEQEGIFINSNVLHRICKACEGTCIAYSFVFSARLISGALDSVFEQRFVKPLMHCSELPYVIFHKEEAWQREAAQHIYQAFVTYDEAAYGFEFLVREELSRMWYLIVKHHQEALVRKAQEESIETKRMKVMLEYLHQHYDENVQLAQLASLVNISERECLRCFRKILEDTPVQYLLKYRVSKAASYLEETTLSITEVSARCGFDDPSYFAKIFKRFVHISPRAYRKKYSV